nr:heavy metal-binding domain-containing protein [Limosilactobacillus avistercoris]
MAFGTAADHQQAVKVLRKNAQKIGADVIVSMRFDSNNSTVTAYGTAVKLK